MLSEKPDLQSAKVFFKQAIATVGHKPERVTTDKHASYRRVFVKLLVAKSVIVPANTSITELSRIIAASNNAIIRCVALVHSSSYPTSVKCSIDNEKNTAMGGVFFIQFKAVMKIKSARQY